jgi:hypothetical protein
MAVSLHCLLPATWVPPLETPSAAPEEVAAAAAATSSSSSAAAARSKRYAVVDDPRRVLITAATSDRPFVDGRGQALLDSAAGSSSSSDFDAIDRAAPR